VNVNFSDDLFIGVEELNRFKQSIFEQGFKFNLQAIAKQFGIIKNDVLDATFSYFQVSNGSSANSIVLNEGYAFDANGDIIYQASNSAQVSVLNANIWQWVKISYQFNNIEQGTVSIGGSVTSGSNSSGGTNTSIMVGVGTEFTKILRGQPDYPTLIKFTNSVNYNTAEYEVLEVIDDNNALIQGIFPVTETGLQYSIIGTFTPGAYPTSSQQQPFQYDSCLITLVQEVINNTPPVLNTGYEFYVARINNTTSSGIIIQDKRADYLFKTIDLDFIDTIDNNPNPLIGIENVRFDSSYTTQTKNIVELAWGFRSQNWTLNISNSTITLSAGTGGKYKTNYNFNSGDFNGWRLYAPDGSYSKIVTSTLNGGAIILVVDSFDVNSYSPDGGITFLTNQFVVVTPDVEEIEIIFTPNPSDSETTNQIQRFAFQINEKIGRCDVLVYNSPTAAYVVTYRYKQFKRYSSEQLIPSDNLIGYYNESSFDSYGNLLSTGTTKVTYISSLTTGFIILTLAPNAFKNFSTQVNLGDKKGINNLTSLTGITNVELVVGVNYNYLLFTGNITLSGNVNINISLAGMANGNQFIIQFNCTTFNLNDFTLTLNTRNVSTLTPIKVFTIGDFYQMKNTPNGIIVTATSDGTTWWLSQNYDLGLPNQVIDLYNVAPSTLFDISGTKMGIVAGLFGYGIADGTTYNGITSPDLRSKFIAGLDPTNTPYNTPGNVGGNSSVTLIDANLPPLDLPSGYDGPHPKPADGSGAEEYYSMVPSNIGSSTPFNIIPPFFTLIKAFKLF